MCDTVFEGQMGLNELPVLVSACFLCHRFETAINGEGLVIQHQPWSRRAPHGSIMSIIKSTKHYITGYREWPTNFKTFHTTLIQNELRSWYQRDRWLGVTGSVDERLWLDHEIADL